MKKKETKKFIKCDTCGKYIWLYDDVYFFNGYCGLYCCAECFAAACGERESLTMRDIENTAATLYEGDVSTNREWLNTLDNEKFVEIVSSVREDSNIDFSAWLDEERIINVREINMIGD